VTNCTCVKGYTGTDGADCSACVLGTYKDVNGSAVCTLCPGGKYSAATAAMSEATCSDCPTHSYSHDGSTNVADCACNLGYTGPHGGACEACAVGTYKEVNGSAACTLCVRGKYSTETGQILESTCKDCPSNTYSGPGSSAQTGCICNAGYSGPDGGECKVCGVGSYKNVNGSSPCVTTTTPDPSTTTPTPTAAPPSTSVICNAGETGPAGSCTPCSAGTFKNTSGSHSCSDCPSNSSSLDGSVMCVCAPGFTGPDGGSCEACRAGSYKSVNGSAACTLCSRGKYSAAPAATSVSACVACAPNTYSGPGSSALTDCICNAGYSGRGGSECVTCEPGKYKRTTGSVGCTNCGAGTYSTVRGAVKSRSCLICPAHSSSPEGSASLADCTCNSGYQGEHLAARPAPWNPFPLLLARCTHL